MASPPQTDRDTLGALVLLHSLRSIVGLYFMEGIGNAETEAVRLPTSLKVMLTLRFLKLDSASVAALLPARQGTEGPQGVSILSF